MPDGVIQFRDVTYKVGGREILHGSSLRVAAGETLVLLGRSGSGKTTALRLVNGMLFPASGQVLVEGRSTLEWDPVRLKRQIGYVIQDGGLFPHFTIARNVGLVPELEGWPKQRIDERVQQMLRLVGLDPTEYGGRLPKQLSGGQKQRAGVARALAADPAILLFDEPFGALDPLTRRELQQQFLKLRRDLRKTSIFVTHDMQEAMLLGTRIALLDEGRLVFEGTPDEFRTADIPQVRLFLEGGADAL